MTNSNGFYRLAGPDESSEEQTSSANQNQPQYQKPQNYRSRSHEIYNPKVNAFRFSSSYGIKNLEGIITEVNKGQKDLEMINRMDNSFIYRSGINLYDSARKKMGLRTKPRELLLVFKRQLNNVSKLNTFLASMCVHYKNNTDIMQDAIYQLSHSNQRSEEIRSEIGTEFQDRLFDYQRARQEYETINRDSDPIAFNQAVQNYVNSTRNFWNSQLDSSIIEVNSTNFKKRIDTLLMQFNILNMVLQSAIKLSYSTKQYSDALSENYIAWTSIKDLSQAVSHVSQGIDVLSDFNENINRTYSASINQIIEASNNNRSEDLLDDMNSDVRNILNDIDNSSWSM